MRSVWAAIACVAAQGVLAQAGTLEVTADGCKLNLPQAEARNASRIRWSGKCVDGLADGRGVVRIYVGGRINRVSEATFSAGKATGASEAYFVRGGQVVRSRAGDQLEIAATELPTWALELSMLAEDRPRAAPKPATKPVQQEAERAAQEAERKRLAAERDRAITEAKAAAERAAADARAQAERVAAEKAAQEAELRRQQAEKERELAEAKVAAERAAREAEAKAVANFVPGRGFADGGSGNPMRGVVSFRLTTPDGRELGVATFVAGKGVEAIRQNANALAAAYEKVSPFNGRLAAQPEVGAVCGGPGYVVEARVTYPSSKSYGWYAGCMGEDLQKAAKSMQELEERMHRDFKVSPASFWAYQYLIVGYVDEGGMRGRGEYERVARPGLMAPGRVMVLAKPEQWAECTAIVNRDPKLRDKAGCLREAVDKLKSALGLR